MHLYMIRSVHLSFSHFEHPGLNAAHEPPLRGSSYGTVRQNFLYCNIKRLSYVRKNLEHFGLYLRPIITRLIDLLSSLTASRLTRWVPLTTHHFGQAGLEWRKPNSPSQTTDIFRNRTDQKLPHPVNLISGHLNKLIVCKKDSIPGISQPPSSLCRELLTMANYQIPDWI